MPRDSRAPALGATMRRSDVAAVACLPRTRRKRATHQLRFVPMFMGTAGGILPSQGCVVASPQDYPARRGARISFASSRNRATRSATGGCVEKSFCTDTPVSGATMKRCDTAGLTGSGIFFE